MLRSSLADNDQGVSSTSSPKQVSVYEQTKRKRVYAIKKSGLYNFILDNKSRLNKQYSIAHIANKNSNVDLREAFLIKIDENLIPFTLYGTSPAADMKRHLTIDKLFSEETSETGGRGFLYAHYTERYSLPQNESALSEEAVVHVYFNRQGQYICCQVRVNGELKEISSEQEYQIKSNSQQATLILNNIINQKAQQYVKLLEKANELGILLEQFSLAYHGSKENYLSIAKEFLNVIDKINLYNDTEEDCRGHLLRKTLQAYEHQELSAVQITKENSLQAAEVDVAAASAVPANVSASQKDTASSSHKPTTLNVTLESIYALEQKLAKLIAAGSSITIEQQIEMLRISKELQDNLLELVFMNTTGKQKKKHQKLIERVEGQLKKIPSCEELLKKYFSEGNVENFKAIFDNFGAMSTNLYIMKFLINVVFSSNDENRQRKIDICEYLYENSESYRQLVLYSSNQLYKIDASDIFHLNSLVAANQFNRFDVFHMLLRHGFDPNSNGLEYQGRCISTLRACIWHFNGDVRFISSLLDYNVTLNRRTESVMTNSSEIQATLQRFKAGKSLIPLAKQGAKHFKQAKESSSGNSDVEKTASIINAQIEENSDFVAACKLKYYSLASMILTREIQGRLSLENLTLHLAKLTLSNNQIVCFLAPAILMPGGVYIVDNREEMHAIVYRETQLWDSIGKPTQQLQMIFSTTSDKDLDLFQCVRQLGESFREKCQKNPEAIQPAFQNLSMKSKEFSDCFKTRDYCLASVFLKMQKGKLEDEEIKEIIGHFCRAAHALYKQDGLPLKMLAQVFYNNAVNTSKFCQVLVNHPLTRLAETQIQRIDKELEVLIASALPAHHGSSRQFLPLYSATASAQAHNNTPRALLTEEQETKLAVADEPTVQAAAAKPAAP